MKNEKAIHSNLITVAASNVLRPLGLIQKGRSRTWLDDHGWWVGVVEFQPSAWSRGSYLNVGCMWLWCVKDYISFDEGYRIQEFTEFQDEVQFSAVASSLAERAAEEVVRYRELFPNVQKLCSHYLHHAPKGFWPTFHAAVACALAGRPDDAKRFFKHFIDMKGDGRVWVEKAQVDASALSTIAEDTSHFRDVIVETIHRARELQKLPVLTPLNFE